MGQDPDHTNRHIPHIRVGMRTVKTVIAVFICCVIDYLRGASPVQSTIAAILCIQPSRENSWDTAVTRTIATLLGGFGAAFTLIAMDAVGIVRPSILFYFILSALLLPLIYIPVALGKPNGTALTCIVFLVIAFSHTDDSIPVMLVAFHRIVDTMVGNLVALPVNILLPSPSLPACCKDTAPPPDCAPIPDTPNETCVPSEDSDPPADSGFKPS